MKFLKLLKKKKKLAAETNSPALLCETTFPETLPFPTTSLSPPSWCSSLLECLLDFLEQTSLLSPVPSSALGSPNPFLLFLPPSSCAQRWGHSAGCAQNPSGLCWGQNLQEAPVRNHPPKSPFLSCGSRSAWVQGHCPALCRAAAGRTGHWLWSQPTSVEVHLWGLPAAGAWDGDSASLNLSFLYCIMGVKILRGVIMESKGDNSQKAFSTVPKT